MSDTDPNLPAKAPVERVFVNTVGGSAQVSDTGQKLAGVVRTGFGAMTSTVRWMGWLGFGLALAAGYIAGRTSGIAGFLAVVFSLGFTAVVGFALAWQRAGLLTLADGIVASGIASKLFRSVFDKLIGGTGETDQGLVSRTAGRIPLSQAEVRLSDAFASVSPELQASGVLAGVFRKAHGSVIATIRRITLAEFRREGSDGGGVDLLKVRDHLANRIDAAAAEGIRRKVRLLTAGYVLLTVLVVLGVAWGLKLLFV
ncbi:hypothetical protein [Humisphaera borealis]|uniref:Uncharacterized protein n=1 Tax=Humisphaera borealis TaxID=2807512 RepID=A0A7M2WU22_9BACT|nr:hypothetical protein [Humisphaera borealis]QOV88953.1 hypothetical protein IPV69_22430 [Humisphaera borealis]